MKIIHVIFKLITFLLVMLTNQTVSAHGGVDYDKDVCLLTVGPYKMNFTGYLPETDKSEEFCDDIPGIGLAIVVLDYIDKPLRNMQVDFRIMADVNNIGNSATLKDLGSEEDIEASTIYYVGPKVYQKGTLMYEKRFDKPGHYIGMLTVKRADDQQTFISIFPFSVGFGMPKLYLYLGIGALLLVPLIGYIVIILQKPSTKISN